MAREAETIPFEFRVVRKDAPYLDAVLFELTDGGLVWIPRSQLVDEEYEEREDGSGVFEIPKWIAIKKGLY